MFTPSTNTRHHLAHPQVFNIPQYTYGVPQQGYGSGSNTEQGLGSDLQMNWHATSTGNIYQPCARGGFDDWSPQPSSPTSTHVSTSTGSSIYNYSHPSHHYRLGSSSPQVLPDYQTPSSSSGSAFLFPDVASLSLNAHHLGPGTSQPSPDSGVAHSSDGVPSGSESPGGVHVQQASGSESPNSRNNGRPQQARSPYEWMKKTTYQSTPNPGKTRTKDKYRVVYTDLQRLELEKEFHYSRYITIRRKGELALTLGLSERQVKIWFQNRRAKERKQNKKREELMRNKDSKDLLHAQVQHLHAMSSQGLLGSTNQHLNQDATSPLLMAIKPILGSDSEACPC